MIHKFKQNDINVIVDVNSGAIHLVDEIVYALIDDYPFEDQMALINKYKTDFNETMIIEAINEIDTLVNKEQLFTNDSFISQYNEFSKQPIVKAMCLHIAHDCNIRCRYCFASQGDFKGDRSMMSYEVGQKALKYLCEHSGKRRNLEVDFFGGEPLMNFEVVKKLVDYGRSIEKSYDKKFRFTITTNGVLLNDETIDYINENMDNVVLSIDGRKEINDHMRYTISGDGTYDVILPKFKKLVERRGDKTYYVRGTFTAFNADFSKDVLHLADQGFKLTSVEPVVSTPDKDYTLRQDQLEGIYKEYEMLADEIVKRNHTDREFKFFHFLMDLGQGPCAIKRVSGCGAGTEYLAVTPEGDFYPCHQFVGDESFKIGDVDSGVVNKELVNTFNGAHVYSKPDCTACWAKFYCSGGCHANAYNFNHDVKVPYKMGCDMEKKRIECSIYIKAKEMMEG